jgi:transcriptional regulator with XRE-family HTH domain
MKGRPKGKPNGTHYLTSGIAKARIRAGMTGADMCALLGLKSNHATKIERGTVSLPAHDALTLCRAWNVTLEELLDGVPQPARRKQEPNQ